MCCIGLVIGELPIILFNLGLDEKGALGMAKIEEMLMDAFLESKNNLTRFAADVDKLGNLILEGIQEYQKAKEQTNEVLKEGEENGRKPTQIIHP